MNDATTSRPPAEKELIDSLMKERRKDRLWRNIRSFIWIAIILLWALLIFIPKGTKSEVGTAEKPYISLVRLTGPIMPTSNFSARKVIPLLQKAFADKQAKGVVLVINSPGGSPVQAAIIHDKILQLKKRYKKKVVVLGMDVLASGAYLVATAADEIFVHKDTITGSIGVIMSGFGFTDAIQKLGVSRRVFTAGQNKDRLDPFLPMTLQDKTKIEKVLQTVHQNFINDVLQGRGNKLKGNRQELFSGDFWTGQEAVTLGLADGTTNLWTLMKTQFDVSHYKNYSRRPSLLEQIFKDAGSEVKLGLTNHTAPVQARLPIN